MRVRRALQIAVGLLVVALLAVGVVGSASARTGVLSTFTDPAGDSHGAPDLTTFWLDYSPETKIVTISLTPTGFQAVTDVVVFLNTDKNDATGSPNGSEFRVAAGVTSSGRWWQIARWDGGTWQAMPVSSTTNFTAVGDTWSWTVTRDDLGGAPGFTFWAVASLYDASGSVTARDLAPDGGAWSYDFTARAYAPLPTTPPAARPVIGSPTTTPARALAGKRFSVRFPVTRSDTGGPLTGGTMVCDPSVAGKVIPHAESFKKGAATLSFVIPKGATGKLLKVKVTIKAGGEAATRVATFRVG